MAQFDPFDKSSFRSKLLPFESEQVDLGKTGQRFRDGYMKTLTVDTINYVTLNPPVSGASFPLLASPDGSAGAPAYSWATDTTMGLFRAGAGLLGHAIGGVATFQIAAAASTVQQGNLVVSAGTASAQAALLTNNTNQLTLGTGTLGVITMAALGGARTWTLPDVTGTFITTGNLTSITTVGTVTAGTWQGTIIDTARGGWGQSMAAATGVPSWSTGTLTLTAFANGSYVKSTAAGLSLQAVPIGVADGGTGATTLTNHGVLLGQAAAAVVGMTALSKGQLLVGQTGADPVALAISTDAFVLTLDSAQAAGVKWAAAGGGTGPSIVDTVTTPVTVASTTTETTVYTKSITGNTIGASGRLQLQIICTVKDTFATVAARTITVRAKYGATTLCTQVMNSSATVTSNACPPVVTLAQIGGPIGMRLSFDLANINNTAVQNGLLSTPYPVPIGAQGSAGQQALVTSLADVFGTAAEDSTAAKTLLVSVQWSASDANCSFIMKEAKLVLLP